MRQSILVLPIGQTVVLHSSALRRSGRFAHPAIGIYTAFLAPRIWKLRRFCTLFRGQTIGNGGS